MTTIVTNPLNLNMPDGVIDLDGDAIGADTLLIQQPLYAERGSHRSYRSQSV